MKSEDLSYHEARAEEELALAETAATAEAVRVHVALADMHLDLLYRDPAAGAVPYGVSALSAPPGWTA